MQGRTMKKSERKLQKAMLKQQQAMANGTATAPGGYTRRSAAAFANTVIVIGDSSFELSSPLYLEEDTNKNKEMFHPFLIKQAEKVLKNWNAWNALSDKKKDKVVEPPKFLIIKKNVSITVIPNNQIKKVNKEVLKDVIFE